MFWSKTILNWFNQHGRHHLPWRNTRDPYAICVSEYMLQQTQVERVIPKYEAWLATFPTWEILAQAKTADVLRLWSGLGYNSRALRLQKLAQVVVDHYQGKLPDNAAELVKLPGIGPYTAAALSSFAFEKEIVVIDTNIERIVLRYFWAEPEAKRARVTTLLEEVIIEASKKKVVFSRFFFQGLMDFGSAICKAKPLCTICPLRESCQAFAKQQFLVKRPKQSHFPHSRRFYRGQLIKTLHSKQKLTLAELAKDYDIQKYSWPEIVQGLEKDGLIAVHEEGEPYVTLPGEV
ncbi:MAG: A/G-specific adenine glycosylase [Candidatus Abawacabacteria bacterium]|nr:A/G-specific adenine glycosylase [Candidatus Abawacabacteria bacterium]